VSALWTLAVNKIVQIQKSKMAAATIWKNEKSQYLCYGWTSFEKIWHGDMLDPPDLLSI